MSQIETLQRSESLDLTEAINKLWKIEEENRFVLDNMSWDFYESFLNEVGDRPIRLAFNEGTLEIMSPGRYHERFNHIIKRLIVILCEEFELEIAGGGSMTFRRKDLQSGIEPDSCFWIRNEPAVWAKKDFDPKVDPPPDLVVEIDITHSSVNRMAIYARLGVPEVWRYDGETLRVFSLTANKTYTQAEGSLSFPLAPIAELGKRIEEGSASRERAWSKAVRAWARELSGEDTQHDGEPDQS